MCDHPINDHPDNWNRYDLAILQMSVTPVRRVTPQLLQQVGFNDAVGGPVCAGGQCVQAALDCNKQQQRLHSHPYIPLPQLWGLAGLNA
jgi:hypothetical protein